MFDEKMEASEVAGSISNTEETIESDEYFEAAAGPIMKAGEVLDEEMEATNSAGSIFKSFLLCRKDFRYRRFSL